MKPALFSSSRRRSLKVLATAPMLPLTTGVLGSLAGVATAKTADAVRKAFVSAEFVGMAAPALDNPAALAETTVGSSLRIHWDDKTESTFELAYKPFFLTGDKVPGDNGQDVIAGGYFDINNKPIMDNSVAGKERQIFSDSPDGTSLLKLEKASVDGVKGNTVFAVVQFEYTTRNLNGDDMYGKLPSPIAVLTLDQDPETGHLSLVKYHNVDTSGVHGLWITCGASLSPWNTHLSSEEYEPDAFKITKNDEFKGFSKALFGDEKKANPYHYGHMPEVTVNPDGTGSIKKHFNLGRISHELIQVMPDKRTALMGDDANNGGLFMFVADQEADLSAGNLYVAKWHQTSGEGPGSADLTWIHLGHATSDEIKALADKLKPEDIMEVKTEDPSDDSFHKIHFDKKVNWIKVKPGMEKTAAFLETHRYAALVGGSMGFSKMEGTTVNAKDKIAYSAMSYVRDAMLDGSGDIKVQGPYAGAVYALNLKDGQKDNNDKPIASAWVPVDMKPPAELVGEDLKTPDALGNTANADRIANPDNIKFSEKLRTLFIGEDSGTHVNNFLWAYNVDTKSLVRLLSCPAGAESTGLQSVDELNGWTYIMSNFQHAGDWEKGKGGKPGLHDVIKDKVAPLINENYHDRFSAAVGYLTGKETSMKI